MNSTIKNATAHHIALGNNYAAREHMVGDLYLKVSESNLIMFNPDNAGKRGKKVEVLRVTLPGIEKHFNERHELIQEVLDCTTLAEVKAAAQKMKAKYAGKLDPWTFQVGGELERGIDVVHPFEGEIKIENANMSLRISTTEFMVRDLTDRHNEPTLISAGASKTSCQKLYKLIRSNPSLVESATFGQVWNLIRDNGVRAHHYCAID